jgi:hypothetical protein
MHRELYRLHVNGDAVVVQLALQGTPRRPAEHGRRSPRTDGQPDGRACCDVFELDNGKIKRFDCYPSGTVILAQLRVLGALDAAVRPGA